ncbi:HD-GYP domain-containing protein [Bacillus sp. T3]|uniref:HD-GYP domain-containing protein n=1 Tax=Bacillus sp. T3 TaxID=467262 RepID=UPI002982019D|nr:HD-GYP domain-containing protein [Bacillus sp. T3]
MERKAYFTLENSLFYRSLFFNFLITVPILTLWSAEFNFMYILIVIFFGIGFSTKSTWFKVIISSTIACFRAFSSGGFDHPTAFFALLLIYTFVTFLSAAVTNQYIIQKRNETELIMTLSKLLDSRDKYTANHSENVASYSLKIAKKMGLSKYQCKAIYIGGLLHDTGKIGVPESVLIKPAKLTANEYEIIKTHPVIGYETLKPISFIRELGVLEMILYHHERFDGKGYPFGLKGEEIPLPARIMAIADSFDAMTSSRVYRDGLGIDYALTEIEINKGKQFDPEIAEVFLRIMNQEKYSLGQEVIQSAKKIIKF